MAGKNTDPDLFAAAPAEKPKALSSNTTKSDSLKVTVLPQFRLVVHGDQYAGTYLQRAEPLPIERFVFETNDEAVKAAERLQLYIDCEHPKTMKKKKA